MKRKIVFLLSIVSITFLGVLSCKSIEDTAGSGLSDFSLPVDNSLNPPARGVIVFMQGVSGCPSVSLPEGRIQTTEIFDRFDKDSFQEIPSDRTVKGLTVKNGCDYTVSLMYTCNDNGTIEKCYRGTGTLQTQVNATEGSTVTVDIPIMDMRSNQPTGHTQQGVATAVRGTKDLNVEITTHKVNQNGLTTMREFFFFFCSDPVNIRFEVGKNGIFLPQDCGETFQSDLGTKGWTIQEDSIPDGSGGLSSTELSNSKHLSYWGRRYVWGFSKNGEVTKYQIGDKTLSKTLDGINKITFYTCDLINTTKYNEKSPNKVTRKDHKTGKCYNGTQTRTELRPQYVCWNVTGPWGGVHQECGYRNVSVVVPGNETEVACETFVSKEVKDVTKCFLKRTTFERQIQ